MKVCVSVLGRFHAFNLAQELHRQGALSRLITSYPKFVAKRFDIPSNLTSTVLSNELIRRGWAHLPHSITSLTNPIGFFCDHFETRAARYIPDDADVYVGWSGVSLAGIKRASSKGMMTVVERGSSHIETQSRLVTEEYEQFGFRPRIAHPAVVEKELIEYETADFISVPSHFVRNSFIDEGIDPNKLIHVPYGVSLESFSPPPAGTRENDNVFRIIHVGGVNLRKGCHHLIQAFRSLQLPNAELLFVGNVAPEMKPFQERYASPSVVFQGAVPQAELINYYAKANVFCLASIEEGLAMVTAQAMACGLPVVATTNTGAQDLIVDGTDGFIVPIRSPEALAEKIEWLYENRNAREAMGASALDRVRSNFSWTDYGNRILRAYGTAMDSWRENRSPAGPRPGEFAA